MIKISFFLMCGASRLGGCAIADGLVFGRIAADTAVAAKPAAL